MKRKPQRLKNWNNSKLINEVIGNHIIKNKKEGELKMPRNTYKNDESQIYEDAKTEEIINTLKHLNK